MRLGRVGKRGASDGRRMVRIVCGPEYGGSDGIEAACRSGAMREDPTGPACIVDEELVVFCQVRRRAVDKHRQLDQTKGCCWL
ncbi:hypothetical protein L917_06950 [Phytophthora nicotianae]|uniref:Uncharacterized protein n=1 Tax=Phytophthora nicotianae TaxID=4792 RepID=W2LET9_PHYNI|nr:hypothetical protein L917_06950 [Phytophthora nicotianae]